MASPINIYNSKKIIELSTGAYSVNVLGGWSVSVGAFSLTLRKINNGNIIEPRKTIWRIQSYSHKKRAKKIFNIDIINGGEYLIEFKNQKDLKVRPTNLFITRLFEKEIPNEDIEISINRRF